MSVTEFFAAVFLITLSAAIVAPYLIQLMGGV